MGRGIEQRLRRTKGAEEAHWRSWRDTGSGRDGDQGSGG